MECLESLLIDCRGSGPDPAAPSHFCSLHQRTGFCFLVRTHNNTRNTSSFSIQADIDPQGAMGLVLGQNVGDGLCIFLGKQKPAAVSS